jgi:hypothetical protein
MSEKLQDVNVEAQPAAPTLSPEQFNSIKQSLMESLHKNYGQFIGSIQTFPVMPLAMQQAFLHFDTGFLWFEKAIVNMPQPTVQVSQASPQPEAPESALESQAPEAQQAPESAPIDSA